MSTKKRSNNFLLLLLLFSALLFQQCDNTKTENHSHQAHNSMSGNDTIEHLIVSPSKQVLSRQSTVKLQMQNVAQTIRAQGYIDFDKTKSQSIAARFGGRIEKLYVKYDLQSVKKGDKVLELYSPELNTFQEEHLFLLRSNVDKTLLEQSRQKLKLLGITDNQVSLLEKNGTFAKTITIYSPVGGYVLFNSEAKNSKNAEASQQAPMNNMSMNEKGTADKTFNSGILQIREGLYVNKGQTLFNVNDLQNVWGIVSVSSEYYSAINPNSRVNVISELFPDKPISGKVSLVEQTFEESNQRFVRIRIDLSNTNEELKLNSLITAEIPFETKAQFKVPVSAVYRTGLNSFVWVKIGTTEKGTDIFQLRKVTTGSATNGIITVINGLSANEEVAEHAGYLADSETFLNDN